MRSMLSETSRRKEDFFKPSVIALIAANLIPLGGVMVLGWSTFAIVVVYWAENVIIGSINVFKLMVCSPSADAIKRARVTPDQLKGNSREVQKRLARPEPHITIVHHVSKLFYVPFFIVHYGMFCMGHGVFIFELLGKGHARFGSLFDSWSFFWEQLREERLIWAVGALAASHLFSFFLNFIYRGEYRRITVPQLMSQPYGRIVILHIAILFGAFLILALGSPIWMLAILIIGKTILDIGLHLSERQKNSHLQNATPIVGL